MDHPQGTAILIMGILSLPLLCACVGGILGIVAWVMGNNAIKEIDANPAAYSNRSTVQIGRVLGIVATCLWVVTIVIRIVMAVLVMASSSGSGY